MAVQENLTQKTRTVKTEILFYVLPIVVIGLVVMAGIIFRYVGSTFEQQLTTSSLKNAQEVAGSVSDWLDAGNADGGQPSCSQELEEHSRIDERE